MLQRLNRMEDRLERILAGGWRTAVPDLQELAAEAAAVTESLPNLAEALSAVTRSASPVEGLRAITLALTQVRLLRTRLALDLPPPGAWQPLSAPVRARKERVLPLCRMPLGEGEVWACARLRGAQPGALVLLTPLPGVAPGWLTQPLEGTLRWEARYPLGAAGEVEACSLLDAAPYQPEEDLVESFRKALAGGKLKERLPLFGGGGPYMALALGAPDLPTCVWPDNHPAGPFSAAGEKAWTLSWVDGALVMPLCLLRPGGLLRRPALLHLLPGTPEAHIPT